MCSSVKKPDSLVLLKAENVCYSYSTKSWRSVRFTIALNGVSININRGDSIGIAGRSGSGKTTFIRVLAGLLEPSCGRVWLDGHNIYNGSPLCNQALLRGILFQDNRSSMNPHFSVESVIGEPLRGLRQPSETTHSAIALVMEELGIPLDYLKRNARSLSSGEIQLVCLARALVTQPDILLLDEPTSTLDVLYINRVLQLLNNLKKTKALTLVVASHHLGVLRQICDTLAILDNGELVTTTRFNDFLANPSHPASRRLLHAATRKAIEL